MKLAAYKQNSEPTWKSEVRGMRVSLQWIVCEGVAGRVGRRDWAERRAHARTMDRHGLLRVVRVL